VNWERETRAEGNIRKNEKKEIARIQSRKVFLENSSTNRQQLQW
jgi:hypothetical protein